MEMTHKNMKLNIMETGIRNTQCAQSNHAYDRHVQQSRRLEYINEINKMNTKQWAEEIQEYRKGVK